MNEVAGSSAGELKPSLGLRQVVMAREVEEQGTKITDLPAVVLDSILAHLDDPVDVMSTLCTCRLFWVLVRTAPFRLRLRPRQSDCSPVGGCEDVSQKSGRLSPPTALFWIQAALCTIRTHMCATRELDLAGWSIVDNDVAAILADLRCLERLILDNCQKLTSAVTDVLAASVRDGPLSVSLQRCYGLGPASAGNLVLASAADGSRLRSLLLSHLNRLDVPRDLSGQHVEEIRFEKEPIYGDSDVAKNLGSLNIGPGLRILALNNCAGLTAPVLASVAKLCPQLELLLLGGSGDGLGLSRAEVLSKEKIAAGASALVRTVELLPRLRVLEVTFFTSAVAQAVREQDKKNIQIWDYCEENSVAAAAWVLDYLKKAKPGSAVNDLLRHIVIPVHCANSPPERETTPVLFSKSIRAQFCQNGSTLFGTGSFAYTNFSAGGKLATLLTSPQNVDRWESLAEDVTRALRGAANCSDIRKRTPLHMAAARGDAPMIAGLLAIGAVSVGVKDSSGATALFVAAESGYAQACELLLQSGADVLASNRAGETPLYIAALRGHLEAVGIMLAHCHERGVNWQDSDVYGDGWTPLMAAAVADRRDVGKMLLWAAGVELGMGSTQAQKPLMALNSAVEEVDKLKYHDLSTLESSGISIPLSANDKQLHTDGKSKRIFVKRIGNEVHPVPSSKQLPQLLDVQNRYGQTALHIAAQKGSVWFVQNLLDAGVSLDVQNAHGLRAVDVAKKHNHKIVADILREWESSKHKKSALPSGSTKSTRKARRRNEQATRVATLDHTPLSPDLDCCNLSCFPSDTDQIAMNSRNNFHPGLAEIIQSSPLFAGKQPVGAPGGGLYLLETDGIVENARTTSVNDVHGLVRDAVSNSCSLVPTDEKLDILA